jgi:hypothetical protein
MAARNKKKTKAAAPKRGRKPLGKPDKKGPRSRPVRTAFMFAFETQFVGTSEPPLWPPKDQSKEQSLKDMQVVFETLFNAFEYGKLPNRDGSNSITDRIADILANTGWPKTAPVPPDLKKRTEAVRRYEISRAMDALLEAYNRSLEPVPPPKPPKPPKPGEDCPPDPCTDGWGPHTDGWPPHTLYGWGPHTAMMFGWGPHTAED